MLVLVHEYETKLIGRCRAGKADDIDVAKHMSSDKAWLAALTLFMGVLY